MHPDIANDPFHTDIIKEKLTRNLPNVLPDVIDELTFAVLNKLLFIFEDEPTKVLTLLELVSRGPSSLSAMCS